MNALAALECRSMWLRSRRPIEVSVCADELTRYPHSRLTHFRVSGGDGTGTPPVSSVRLQIVKEFQLRPA